MSLENRPRERLQKRGVNVLSDAEILAVILQKGTSNENVIDMSNRLISTFGFNKLSACSLKELQSIKGIGVAKACQIKCLFEFCNRYNLSKLDGKPIKFAKDVYDYCSPKISHLDKENFIVLHLDTRNRIIKDEVVSVGTLNSSIVHPREVFKSAIKEGCNSIILVHNHPSGVSEPSSEDREITDLLTKAGELLGIKVLDHVIVGKNNWYSFKD